MSAREGPGKWTAFSAESDEDLEHTVQSNTPEGFDAPQHSLRTGINDVSSRESDILEPDLLDLVSCRSKSSTAPTRRMLLPAKATLNINDS